MQIKINGSEVPVKENETILEVAERLGYDIPTLCYDPDLPPQGSCRMCVCEVNGKMTTACNTKVSEGMDVLTDSERVIKSRRLNAELLLSKHKLDDNVHLKNDLLKIKEKYGLDKPRFPVQESYVYDDSSSAIVRDNSKCILCGKCVNKCQETQGVAAICFVGRGVDMHVSPAFNKHLADTFCVNCGQCSLVCPTGAIKEVDSIKDVKAAIDDPKKIVVVQTAPAVRASIGEEFGLPPGSLVTKKLVSGLRRLGFDKVFDTDFTADLTIMEEGTELISRVKNKGTLPLVTSCSPGWIKFCEHFFPECLSNLSTCKSPQQMFGALAKTFYAEKIGADPKNMVVVSIMPCTAKKFECKREEMNSSGFQDVDYVLTTRELARFMKQEKINLSKLYEDEYDDPLGESTGAGVIFGATGGVMEAALRTAYEIITGKTLGKLEFMETRGLPGIKTGSVGLNGLTLNFAVASGLSNARKLMEEVKAGTSKYHFIEIMCCPGGCLAGGGQPIPTNDKVRLKRMQAIYQEDKNMTIRKSHENPSVIKIYEEFLEKPNSHKAHELLHTSYVDRSEEC
ncbi:MAG: [FeFe] hydrogenase, group A [Nanoarchaeota archaeon]|nr:[FeFe] hydrogenase, group A [Nanoarchaeota archaeon]